MSIWSMEPTSEGHMTYWQEDVVMLFLTSASLLPAFIKYNHSCFVDKINFSNLNVENQPAELLHFYQRRMFINLQTVRVLVDRSITVYICLFFVLLHLQMSWFFKQYECHIRVLLASLTCETLFKLKTPFKMYAETFTK